MSLPLRIKVDIRDLWNKPEGEVQQAFADVKRLVGYEVQTEPEWHLLWLELGKHYPDNSRFVPDVANAAVIWCRSLLDLVDDDTNEKWTEMLLERLKSSGILRVTLNAGDDKPITSWLEKNHSFEICLPKSSKIAATNIPLGFHNELRHVFKDHDTHDHGLAAAIHGSTIDDDFTNVTASELDGASIFTPGTTDLSLAHRPAQADPFPRLNMIERPEDLMRKPPYYLMVHHTQYGKCITIQGSHQPTLELVNEYFRKWTKRNHSQTHKPEAAQIILKESCFGLGLMYDRLEFVLSDYDYKHGLSPPLMLNFVESVLGYRLTYQDVDSWTFRREIAFRS